MYYQLIISETGRNDLKKEASLFNIIKETFKELSDIKDYIVDRYGRMPKGKNKIYHDDKNGQSQEIGFLHSFGIKMFLIIQRNGIRRIGLKFVK